MHFLTSPTSPARRQVQCSSFAEPVFWMLQLTNRKIYGLPPSTGDIAAIAVMNFCLCKTSVRLCVPLDTWLESELCTMKHKHSCSFGVWHDCCAGWVLAG
jgi:hypothetical protein